MIAKLTDIAWSNTRDVIFSFDCPDIAHTAIPGQFVEVQVSAGHDPFLRRPFSIYSIQNDLVKLLVRIVGRGTKIMTGWQIDDSVDIIGPLGNGYSWDEAEDHFVLIGGGIGYAPINFLLEKLIGENKNVQLLFAPKREKELLSHLVPNDRLVITVAENRTEIRSLLEQILLNESGIVRMFSCGPDGMMRVIAEVGTEMNIPTELSMEAVMGCGINICVGCVIPIRSGDDFIYKKVCSEGPVFLGEEVIFNE